MYIVQMGANSARSTVEEAYIAHEFNIVIFWDTNTELTVKKYQKIP